MPVSDSYRAFVLEQLVRVAPRIRGKSMFGGVGVYSGDHFFALMDNDTLFFKVDDISRGDFIAARMKPWSPFENGAESTGYYELPADVLEDPDALRPWVENAIAVAARKKAAKPAKNANRPKSAKKAAKSGPKPRKR
ncbi:MAG: TfoX/Sxy family protein [Gemmatimonadales bacterium]